MASKKEDRHISVHVQTKICLFPLLFFYPSLSQCVSLNWDWRAICINLSRKRQIVINLLFLLMSSRWQLFIFLFSPQQWEDETLSGLITPQQCYIIAAKSINTSSTGVRRRDEERKIAGRLWAFTVKRVFAGVFCCVQCSCYLRLPLSLSPSLASAT